MSGKAEITVEDIHDPKWRHFIEEIRELPADSPEWTSVQAFSDQLQLVVKQKRQERRDEKLFQLKGAIEQLLLNHEDLAFFQLDSEEISRWRTNQYPLDRVAGLTDAIQDLIVQFAKHKTLTKQRSKDYEEARQLRASLEDIENNIISLKEKISEVVSSEASPALVVDVTGSSEASTVRHSTQNSPTAAEVVGQSEGVEEDAKVSKDTTVGEDWVSKGDIKTKGFVDEASTNSTVEGPQLYPVSEIAGLLKDNESDENWTALIWSLLAEDDLSGAYWVVQSLAGAAREVPIAPEVLAVLQGSRWLESESDSMVFDIARVVSEKDLKETYIHRLLGMAAALVPSLTAPNTGLIGWLPQKPDVSGALGELAEAVRSFASYGHPLRAEDVRKVEGDVSSTRSLEVTVMRARGLIETYQGRKLKIRRATSVLRYLVSLKGDLGLLLSPVIEGQDSRVEQVQDSLEGLATRQKIVGRINHIDREILKHSRAAPPITGEALKQLVRCVEEGIDLVRTWCEQVRLEQTISRRGDWWSGLVTNLHERSESVLPEVRSELDRMQASSPELKAVSRVLQLSIDQVARILGMTDDVVSESGV